MTWLRLEVTLVTLAFACTILAKYLVVRLHAERVWTDVIAVVWPDFIFFSAAFALLWLISQIPRPRLAVRSAMVVAAVILGWFMCNAAWMIATSVQLQPDVLWLLIQHPADFWPVVATHVGHYPRYAIPAALIGLGVAVWFSWRLVRPAPLNGRGRERGLLLAAVPLLMLGLSGWWLAPTPSSTVTSSTIGFSSGWQALIYLFSSSRHESGLVGAHIVPRVGEREILLPETPAHEMPNVIVLMLESIPRSVTSLGDPEQNNTPELSKLAEQGVEFVQTRVPMSHTSKAFWATLTGETPEIYHDFIEAVPVERPYESLASILGRAGYRSAFYQMGTGTFECAPGMFANLDFDWAWFRENLEDPSAHLHMSGDDFRMLDPMFKWMTDSPEPFLLTTITSVCHDPFFLPEWWEDEPSRDKHQRYLSAVQFTDSFLREFCRRLDEAGLAEKTVLCVIGDHGEVFRPESKSGRWVPYEELIRVPWIIRWPGHVEAGGGIEWSCSQKDVTPTLLTLLGFDVSRAGFDGRNAFEPAPPDRRIFFSTWYQQGPLGYVEGTRKVVYWPYLDRLLAYDLQFDPEEQSPTEIEGENKEQVVEAIRQWKADTRMDPPPARLYERVLYDHWRTFGSGRRGWAYYVSKDHEERNSTEQDDNGASE